MARPINTESVFRALAHPTRRSIVLALRRSEAPASQILDDFAHTKATLSRHLRALQTSGVVTFRRKGTRLIYRVNPDALRPVQHFLERVVKQLQV
jgi:DNA-binding transcriptional ArsR family regulator